MSCSRRSGTGTELRNCGSQILKVRNSSSATFLVRNSAIVLVVHNIEELRRCGLKLRMPTFVHYSVNTTHAKKWYGLVRQAVKTVKSMDFRPPLMSVNLHTEYKMADGGESASVNLTLIGRILRKRSRPSLRPQSFNGK